MVGVALPETPHGTTAEKEVTIPTGVSLVCRESRAKSLLVVSHMMRPIGFSYVISFPNKSVF